jgi:TonB-linked SusC/RagA family outer membrane protein
MWLGAAYAQNNSTVTGNVTDAATGKPLPGVNILVVGTSTGAATNANGKYRLTVPSLTDSLRFSFIGYATKTVPINGQTTINVALQPTVIGGNQLVVTALGITTQKKALGYSVTQVQPKDIVSASVSNTANLLEGQVAGVHVVQGSGGPGSASRVTIRGVSAFTGNNQPLYVVDGIPIDNSNFFSAGEYNGRAGGNGIGSIDPQDIKSISVLKGASAAALYGSRARNGVILITTKSGKGVTGGPQVDVNSTVTVSSMLPSFTDYQHIYGQGSQGKKPNSQDAAIKEVLSSWGAKYGGTYSNFFGGTSKYVYHSNRASDFYRNAVSSRNAVSLAGGSDNGSYYFNATHLFSPSIFPNSNLKRTNLTLRGTHTFFGKLHADVKANYIRQHHHNLQRVGDSPGNANTAIFQLPGNVSLANLRHHYIKPNGMENNIALPSSYLDNPYWVVNQFHTFNDRNRFIGFVKLTYDFTSWLSVVGRTGVDTYKLRHNFVTPYGTIWAPNMDGSMNISENNVLENNTNVMLKIKHALTSDIGVDATFGAVRDFRRNETLGADGQHFKVPGLRTISNMQDITNVYGFSSKQINSLYGAVNLSYKDYLYINGTGRNDWSSTLPEVNNSYFYPSVSGSFVFSDAFSSIMPKWLSFGKLRASWAVVGSDTSPYQLALTYGLLPFTHGGQSLADVNGVTIPLSTLKPTKTKAVEVGLHMNFVNDRVGFDLALYHRKTTNQILSTTISVTSGYSSRVLNAGRLDNKGIEAALTVKPIQNKTVSWNSSFNFASDHSKVRALAGNQSTLVLATSRSTYANITATVGQQYGTIKGTQFKRASNGELLLNQGLPQRTSPDSLYVLGRGTPSWTAGWNNTIHYKSWSLNFLFDVSWGGQLYSGTNQLAMANGLLKKTLVGRAQCEQAGYPTTGCYVAKGIDEATGNENNVAVLPATYYNHVSQVTAPFVYNANYIKFRQAKLSYRLPQSVVGKTPLHSVTLSIVGRNLAYIYNSVPNVDPEAALNSGNAQGLELSGLPASRSIGFNIDLKF